MEFITRYPHILEKIFTSCKKSTLLQCRLVCRQWADEVTRILRKRGVTIAFRSTEDIEEFLQDVNRPISQTYKNFLIDIPCPRDPTGVVEEVPCQVVDLLDCYKNDILELKWWYQPQIPQQPAVLDEDVEDGEVGEVVYNEGEGEAVTLRNLHTLHLLSNYVNPSSVTQGGVPQQPQHRMPKYFSRLSTPNLRSLSVQHLYDTECATTVVKLIESSKNPLEYFKMLAKPFPMICRLGVDIQNLRELDIFGIFNGFSCATNETLEAIVRSCPNLEKLGIEFSFRATPDKIQEMLVVLAKTLVEFRCTIQDRNLLTRQVIPVNFLFPEMPKLKVMHMRWSNPGLVYFIDRLPLLESLMLSVCWTRKIQGSIFPGGQTFQEGMAQYTKLTSLRLTEVVSVEQVEVFAKYFPNLTVFGGSFASDEALRVVYEKMRGLRWLTIERKSNITEAAGMCGVEGEEEMGKQVEGLSEMEQLKKKDKHIDRNVPYIGYLKDLETLDLCQLGITWWSILFGVVDLPKLKTLVVQSKALRKSSSNVTDNKMGNIALINFMSSQMKQLRNLTLWIRHTSERPTSEEIDFINQKLYYLEELAIVNHSLCGI